MNTLKSKQHAANVKLKVSIDQNTTLVKFLMTGNALAEEEVGEDGKAVKKIVNTAADRDDPLSSGTLPQVSAARIAEWLNKNADFLKSTNYLK